MFAHEYVVTLDEMPELSTYERQDAVTEPSEPTGLWDNKADKPSFEAYPTLMLELLNISSERRIETVALYKAQGKLVKRQRVGGTSATVSFVGLASGIYLVKTNQNRAVVRVIKK